jgi:CRP-like cAMP-binding protein
VFIAINVYWIVVIILERRPPKMTPDEQTLYVDVFQGCCSARDMKKLISQADWGEIEDGTHLIKQNTDPKKLFIIRQGRASVKVDGQHIAFCEKDSVVGDMSFLTHEKTVADVIADGPVRFLSWQRDALESLFERKAEFKSAIHEVIGRDLIKKLISSKKLGEPAETLTMV